MLGCKGKGITDPSTGIGISSPNLARQPSLEAYEQRAIVYAMEEVSQ